MTNHPNRSQSFDILAYKNGAPTRPWFIRVDCGALDWPELVFPFQMKEAGTDESNRTVRVAARAALKAAAFYYRNDDTGSFSPSLTLLGPDKEVVHQISIERMS